MVNATLELLQQLGNLGNSTSSLKGARSAAGNAARDMNGVLDTVNKLKALNKPGNIYKMAKKNTFDYGFWISNALDAKEAANIMRAIEVDIAQTLQLALHLTPSANGGTNANLRNVLTSVYNEETAAFGHAVMNLPFDTFEGIGLETFSINELRNGISGVSTEASGNGGGGNGGGNANKTLNKFATDITKERTRYNATMIEVKIRLGIDKDSEFSVPLAVRGIAKPLLTEESQFILTNKVQGKNFTMRAMKMLSGEITLAEFLFRTAEVKKDIEMSANLKRSSILAKMSEKRARQGLQKLSTAIKSNYGKLDTSSEIAAFTANGTYICSKGEIDQVYKETGVDLLQDTKKLVGIMDDMFLANFVIVDESYSIVHVLRNDGDDEFSSNTLSSFHKKAEDNQLKTIMQIANRMK